MTRAPAIFALTMISSFAFGSTALSQTSCAPRAQVLERLTQGYGETQHSIGMRQDNLLMELFASSDSGSWTITITAPNGTTCLIASGHNFETLARSATLSGKGT